MEKPIKALFVFSVSQVWGGEEVWLKFLGRVDKNKINPFCLVFGEGQLSRRLKDIAIPFFVLPLARIRSPFLYGRNLFSIIRLIKKERFEIVNSLGIHLLTTLAVIFLNVTYMLHIHTIHRLPFIDRWCLRKARNVITVSDYSKEFLASYGVNPSNIKVIHNGVDAIDMARRIKGSNLRKELQLSDDIALVGYTGRIVKWKNLELLIKSIPKIKEKYGGNFRFLLVGDTPCVNESGADYKEYLLKSAGMLNVKDKVIFTGRREDIPDILQQVDIFVMPSVLEVCSMAILEAMAMGKPVVGLMAGGNPELVTGETGILVGPKDVEGFADAILNLLANAERRKSLGELARKRIEEFFTVKRNVELMQGAIIECSSRSCGAK